MTDDQLQNEIRKLSVIADEGKLVQLQHDFHSECLAAGGLPRQEERVRTVQHLDAGAIAKSRELAEIASRLFGIPIERCERNTREVLVCDRWSKIALDLIDFHLDRGQPSGKLPQGSAKPARRQAW